MKQFLALMAVVFNTTAIAQTYQEFSSRAVTDFARKSYQQKDRMSDLQHRKEKKFKRQEHIKERQAKRHIDSAARRERLQAHSDRINAHRTCASHHEQVRDMRHHKQRARRLQQQAIDQKQAYIKHERNLTTQYIDMHQAARNALRDLPMEKYVSPDYSYLAFILPPPHNKLGGALFNRCTTFGIKRANRNTVT